MEEDQELTEVPLEALSVQDEEPAQEPQPPVEATPAQKLAAHIRSCSIASQVSPLKKLRLLPPEGVTAEEAAALLLTVGTPEADPALETLSFYQGKKDRYYFDSQVMTPHFAELQALLEDKDILCTIATVARSDSKLYPRPAQFSKLMAYPFYFSEDEILGALARMKSEEQYADIDTVTASNGGQGVYSTQFMSKRYAQSLIQQVEVEEKENP